MSLPLLDITLAIVAAWLSMCVVILAASAALGVAAYHSRKLHVWLSRRRGYCDDQISMAGFK